MKWGFGQEIGADAAGDDFSSNNKSTSLPHRENNQLSSTLASLIRGKEGLDFFVIIKFDLQMSCISRIKIT